VAIGVEPNFLGRKAGISLQEADGPLDMIEIDVADHEEIHGVLRR
jgi:hypothetical protein